MRPRVVVGVFLLVVAAAMLVQAVRGNSPPRVAAASPMRDVLVYAKPEGCCDRGPGGKMQIWVAGVDGSHTRLLTDGTDPSVSPDGRYVAYDQDSNVLVVPTSGGISTTIAKAAAYPSWAPNSRLLAYYRRAGLVVVDVRRGKQVGAIAAAGHDLPQSVTFSPDSKRIAYTLRGAVYVAPTTGGSPLRVTHGQTSVATVWGKLGLAFDNIDSDGTREIWLTDGKPHGARRLTPARLDLYPAFFSASGRELLAVTSTIHAQVLYAVDVPSGKTRPLTRNAPWVPAGLSRDGTTALAVSGCYPNPWGAIETIRYAGGRPHIVALGPCGASWNAR